MTKQELKALKLAACRIRMGVIESTFAAKSGHPGGSLSAADVFAYLYTKELRVDPKNPRSQTRDRFVLSKGHTAPGLYAALANRGFFPVEDLKTLRHIDSYLQGHPNMNAVPGVDMSTGSLAQGVSAAAGMAHGAKLVKSDARVYALLGDGEIQEGQVWEAMMFSAHYKLDNLCIIIDNNGLQIDGKVEEVMSPYPIKEKLVAFGIETVEIDGHSFEELESAFEKAKTVKGKPFAIVMKTTKGKGVDFMENDAGWHGKGPNAEQHQKAMEQLEKMYERLEGEE